MTAMNYYIIDAQAPLVFRSGKPFGAQAGASDANFPLPSSSAGLMRHQYMRHHNIGLTEASEQNRGTLTEANYQALLNVPTFGSLLVRFTMDHPQDFTVLVPKPSNAMYLKVSSDGATEAKITIVRLAPSAVDYEDCGTDLPAGLQPVQACSDDQNFKGKPQKGANFWRLEDFLGWQSGRDLDFAIISAHGLDSIPIDIRTHVAIDDDSLSSEDGQLFQTAGLDLGATRRPHHQGWDELQLGFLTGIAAPLGKQTKAADTLVRFGGEGRLSTMIEVTNEADTTLAVPKHLDDDIKANGGLLITLLTPAIFANGFLPAWLDPTTLEGTLPQSTTNVRLKAAAVDRWQPVSGWDLQHFKPKAMRKAVPAGAVYWFELLSPEVDASSAWLSCISDDPQDCRDSFGVAIIHPWQPSK